MFTDNEQLSVAATAGEFADEGEEGHVHGDDDAADGDAEEADHGGFDECEHVGDGGVHFLFVEVGDLAEHGVEGAGLFADADHLRHHVGEHVGRLQGFDEALAAFDARADAANRFFDDDVARGARRDFERLEDGDARREQGRERAREARDGDLAQDASDQGRFQEQAIHVAAAVGRLAISANGEEGGDDASEDAEAAPSGDEVAEGDDDARREREFFTRAEQPHEDRLELRDDEDQDRGHDENCDDDHGRRVDHGGDHVAAQFDDLLDEGREALENDVENTARLARLDHVDEELIENLRVARHGDGQGRSFLHVLAGLRQDLLEKFVLLLARQNVETLHERQPGVDHHGELARKDRQLFRLHFAAPAELRHGDLAPLLLDRGEHDLFAAQQLLQHVAAVGDALADHHFTESVAAFEDVSGHL